MKHCCKAFAEIGKSTLMLLVVLLFAITKSNAQADIVIGTGTTGNTTTGYPSPMQDYFEGSRSQFLYLASELNAAGMTAPGFINSIKYNVITVNTGTFPAVEQYTIRIGGSSVTTLGTTTWETVNTTVFGPIDYTPVLGINTLTFSTPFFWNGSDNIIIEVCNGDPANTTYVSYTQNPLIPWTTGLSFNGSHCYRADNLGNLCGTATTTNTGTQTTRPNIIFSWTPATACAGTPTAGTATSTNTNILCAGTPFTLGLTGNTLASGITYQWQSSANGTTGWANITGATTGSYTTTQTAATMFYRCIVTCTNGGANSTSSSIQVNSASGPSYASLPYTESFENTWANACNTRDIPNNYWKNTPASGNNSWRRNDDGVAGGGWTGNNGVYTPAASSGTYSARFHSYDASSGTSGSLDVYLNCNTSSANKRLTFDFINTSGTDSLSILLSTDGGTTFTRLDSCGVAAAWRDKEIFFSSLSATTIIRFKATSDFGVTDIGLDNIVMSNWANCSGNPIAGTPNANPLNACAGQTILLTAAGVDVGPGLTYQWQVSTNGGTTWTNIPGATSFSSSTTQIVTSQYRLVVTCTLTGGGTSNSTAVTVTSPTLPAGTYTINKNNPTTWPGAGAASNFNSFNAAYAAVACGIGNAVVFNVVPGTGPYNEQLIINGPVGGASATKTITFNGNGNTISFSATNTNERAVIKLKNTKYFIFDSLTVDATAGTYGFGFHLINNADSNVIRKCTINSASNSTTTNFAGIAISGSDGSATGTGTTLCDYNVIDKNTINGGYYGITMAATFAGGANGYNQITNNIINDFYQYGIYVAASYNTLIESNTIARPTRTNVSEFNGIYFTTQSNTATISKNKITNPFGGNTASTSPFYGINFSSSSPSSGNDLVVKNNLIVGNNGNGLQYGIFNTSTSSVQYFHNTIALDSLLASTTLATRGFFQTGTASGILFYNNIISIYRGGTGQKHCIYLATGNIFSDNNDFYTTNSAYNFTGYYTANRLTLLDWSNATSQDLLSIAQEPVYTSPSTNNYSPSNAAVDNKGLAIGVTDDINNTVRSSTTPDLGAFEFTAPACIAPPAVGTTVITPTTICQNSNVLLNLVIGPYGASQTFQWQASATLAGTYTNVGNPKLTPDTTIISTTSLYYRCEIKCGGATVYSTPILLTVNPALPTGSYTINKALPTNWPTTTVGANFNSFNDAKASMNCGILGAVTFNVVANSGPYTEQLILDSIKGASVVNTITFNGLGNTIAFSSTNTNERAVIKLKSADHIRFDSLIIDATGPNGFGYGVQLINNADSNIIRKCSILANTTLTTANYAGIVINSTDAGPVTLGNTWCDGNKFDRNTISGGFYGVTLVGSATQLIEGNQFTNNTIKDFYTYGLYVGGTRSTLIENNLITRPTRTGLGAGYGIYLSGALNQATLISKNRITNFFGSEPANTSSVWGIFHNSVSAAAGNENVVSNNLIYKLDANGPSYGIYNVGSSNVFYLHNTIAMDNTASTSAGATAAFYQTNLASGIQFKNNIITLTRGGTGAKHGLFLATTTSTIESNYNDFFIQAAGTNNFIGRNGSVDYSTLTAWTAATTDDVNSVNFDPIYSNVTTGDYKPMALAVDNKGTNVNITTDILNVTRSSTTPDVGAYEFAPAPCPATLVGGTATVTPSTGLCLEMPIRLDLTGNTPAGSLTFQWQHSLDGVTGWTNIGQLRFTPLFDTLTTVRRFYRCLISCGTSLTTFSSVTQVNLNALLAGGTYTIDATQPTTWPAPGGTNFQTFQAAVNAILCGIQSSVVFDVKPGTYTEQIRIPYVPGTSATTTVTFKSQNGNAASAELTFASTNAANNYTLKLDSTKYVYFRSLTLSATNTTNGRVVEFANNASYDSLTNCIIKAPITTTTANTIAAVYANGLKGTNVVIKGNTITNGAMGVFFSGTSATSTANDHVIDSNFVTGSYLYGIYTNFTQRLKLNRNTVTVPAVAASTYYGIYTTDNDSSYQVMGNKINISNTPVNVYGIYVRNSDGSLNAKGKVSNNDINATTGNTGNIYGVYITSSPYVTVANNAIAINTTGNASFGLYCDNSSNGDYYNNSVNSTATSIANNHAAYFLNTTAVDVNVKNNIFSHKGGGRAMYIANSGNIVSNYNMLYTTGTVLVQRAAPTATNYATLAAWAGASFQDAFSINFNPAFNSDTDLKPNLNSNDVWAIHGRGVQIDGNDRDHDNAIRPTTLIAGVPDLGAYEFYPNVLPTVLSAIPATPAANTEQTFYYGTDTVMKIKWAATAPPSIQIRRYSGVVPTGLAASNLDSMYFYTKVDIPGGGAYDYDAKLFYVDSWLGSIPQPGQLGLGKTTAGNTNAWVVGFTSRVDLNKRMIYQNSVNFLDRFTGLINPYAPPILPDKDSSNRGKRFWFAYAANQLAGGTTQEMVAYLSAQEAANVQVRINGTSWVRNYFVPANSVVVTENLPKAGTDNAFLNTAGLFDRGISITSDVPIVAYAHGIGSTSSGACMLMPVGVWGYEYKTLGITQVWGTGGNSFFYVIADNDNTKIEINPSVAVSNPGMAANTTTTVILNKGQVLQVIASSTTTELTGSTVKSVPNSAGKCYPIATFSGSSRTQINQPAGCSSGGDFMMQQNFPSSAWGKRYLLAPSSLSGAANTLAINIWRIAVKDPTTVVKRNGTTLTGLINNQYYQINGAIGEYIEADKPITVAQFLTGGTCGGSGVGDPEMIYISPIEQGIKKVGFYRNNRESITVNYLTMIVPTNGIASLKITDGTGIVPPDYTFAHPQNGAASLNGVNYTVVVKRWPSAQQQVQVECDSAFTGITYGLGSVESYGYNMGTLVKNLQALGNINNTLSPTGSTTEYTCANAPFRFTMLLPVIPTSIIWRFSQVPFLTPNADVTVTSPVPTGTVNVNGTIYYKFTVAQDYVFSNPGLYPVQVTYTHPTIESCDNTQTDVIYVQVIPSPGIGFNVTFNGCAGNTALFSAQSATVTGINASSWKWTFHTAATATGQNTSFTYPTAGTFPVKLSTVTADGCVGDSTKSIVVNALPVVNIVTDSVAVCSGSSVTFAVQNPVTGTTYNWYTTATSTTPVFTGTSYNVPAITTTQVWFVEASTASGCISASRKRVVAQVFSILAQPVVTVNQSLLTPTSITFEWAAVPNATGYQVSTNNGATWSTPSSGATGLSHVVSGLTPSTSVTILVRATGTIACQQSTSDAVTGKTLLDQIYVPNAFNPNSPNPVNRVLRVYGYVIQSMQFMVFNQWGEKVFETTNQTTGWDGSYKGKQQPSGVYIYVLKMTLLNGTKSEMKGSINLIR